MYQYMGLKTTTWQGRNTDTIQTTICARDNYTAQSVAVIGPGGIIPLPFLVTAPYNKLQKVLRLGIHQIESLFRKTRLFKLHEYEAQEIYLTLNNHNIPIQRFTVFDIEHAVLQAVRQSIGDEKHISYHIHDITHAPLPEKKYDIIFCYNVLQRTKDPESGLTNIIDSLDPNGLLSLVSNKEVMESVRNNGLLIEIDSNLFTLKK